MEDNQKPDDIIEDPFHSETITNDDLKESMGAIAEKTAEPELITAKIRELVKDNAVEQYILDTIHKTVSKEDDHVINIVLYTGLSTYLKPLHLALKGPSSSGKTYSTNETTKVFPPEDVRIIGSQSAKVISHEFGVMKLPDGTELEDYPIKPNYKNDRTNLPMDDLVSLWHDKVKEWKEKKKLAVNEVDLRYKINVFLEGNNVEGFAMLKPTMSADHEFIDHKSVHPKTHEVTTTRLLGSGTMIFNSVDTSYNEEFTTRTSCVTPNDSSEKVSNAKHISTLKASLPWEFEQLEINRKIIQEYIRQIAGLVKDKKIKSVLPFLNLDTLFIADPEVRSMRNYSHFTELIPAITLLNFWKRPIIRINKKYYIISTIEDVLKAKEIFEKINETTKAGTEQRIINFYNTYLKGKVNGLTIEDLTDAYNKDAKKKLSTRTIRDWIERLIKIEWVDPREEEHKNDRGYIDRRYISYFPLKTDSKTIADYGTTTDLTLKLKTDAENWIKNVAEKSSITQCFFLNFDLTATRIDSNQLLDILSNNFALHSEKTSAIVFKPNSNSESENKPKNVAVDQSATVSSKYIVVSSVDEFKQLSIYKQLEQEGKLGNIDIARNISPHKKIDCDSVHEIPQPAVYSIGNIFDEEISGRYCEEHFKWIANENLFANRITVEVRSNEKEPLF